MRLARLGFLSLIVALSTAAAVRAADTYKVDPVHSQIVFQINHLGVSNILGRFNEPGGTFVLDNDDAGKSTFEISVAAKNVDTGFQKRDDHLRSPDFFNVKQFPTISFKSTGVKKLEDGSYELTGDLTLHGETKPITVKLGKIVAKEVGPQMGGTRAGFDTTFTLKRSDYGMSFMQGPLGDEVTLMINIEGVKQ
jgi:polyisoprenoid-binding protein YceI